MNKKKDWQLISSVKKSILHDADSTRPTKTRVKSEFGMDMFFSATNPVEKSNAGCLVLSYKSLELPVVRKHQLMEQNGLSNLHH